MVRLSRFYSLSKTMNNLLSIEQLTGDEIRDLLALGHRLKAERGHHERLPLKGQTWALIFSKSSTRTRVSFEVGISELGGRPMFLSVQDIQLGRGEPIKDTARVLGRMIHGAAIRTYGQQEVEEFASFSGIPTINALTDEEHPCQILADLLTIEEIYGPGSWKDMKIAFVGDGTTTCPAPGCGRPRGWALRSPSEPLPITFPWKTSAGIWTARTSSSPRIPWKLSRELPSSTRTSGFPWARNRKDCPRKNTSIPTR